MSDSPTSQHPPDSLKALAAAAARGSRAAFETLHRRLGPGLARILQRRMGGRPDLAEELSHRTWIEVWRALVDGRYDPQKAAISTYVYAVAQKLWYQHLRRQQRSAQIADEFAGLLGQVGKASEEPSDSLQTAELLDAVRDCLHSSGRKFSLSDDERIVIIGLATGGTERSLAAELRVAASTIHARKTAAFRKLRGCLAAKGFSSESGERD